MLLSLSVSLSLCVCVSLSLSLSIYVSLIMRPESIAVAKPLVCNPLQALRISIALLP